MEKVGLTELKNSLSVYISRVSEGSYFLITEHDKPVAKLSPLTSDEGATLEERVAALARSGKIQCDKPLQDFESPFTVKIDNFSASDLLVEMRD